MQYSSIRATLFGRRGLLLGAFLFLLFSFSYLLLPFPITAQDVSWKDLVDQAEALYSQDKFVDGIPVAEKAVRVGEETYGVEHPNVARALNILADLYQAQGKYADAEPLYERSLAIREKALGPDPRDVAESLNNLAVLYKQQGKYAKAEPFYTRSLAILEKALGPENQSVAITLNNLAILYKLQGKYAEAEPLYKRSLAIQENTLGKNHPDVANTLNNLAGLYQEQGKYADADPLYERSLTIYEVALGRENPSVANVLSNLASLYRKQGKYDDSEELYKRSLAMFIKTDGPNHPQVAVTLTNLASLYKDRGKYADAEPLFKQSLAIYEEAQRPDNSDLAKALNNLSGLYEDEGIYAQAEQSLKRSSAIYENALGPDHAYVATSLSNLAELYTRQGKYAEAEPLFKRSIAINEKALGPDSPSLAANLNNLATLYEKQGRYAEVEPLLRRSLTIREKALGADHPAVATALESLGFFYQTRGKYAEAERLLKRSLAIKEKVLGPDHPEVAGILNSLADGYRLQRRYADAEPLYERSLAIREKTSGPGNPSVGIALNNLGLLYKQEGKYTDAEPLFKRSLAIQEEALGPDHPGVASALTNLGTLFYAEGNYSEAEPFFERALQNLSNQFTSGFDYMSERERLQFLDTKQSRFSIYLSFCFTYRQENPDVAGKMFDLLLWERELVGSSIASLRAQVANAGDSEAVTLFDQLAIKRSASAQLATERPLGWELSKKTIDDQANELDQQLTRRVSVFAERTTQARASWRDVQKTLQADEAVVEFIRFRFYDGKRWTGNPYSALILTANSKSGPELVSLGDAKDLESDPLRDYRLRMGLAENSSNRGMTIKPRESVVGDTPKTSFYEAFWKPLEPSLKGIHRIYVSPDGVLNQVVFGDVPTSDGHLLMEKYDLRVVSSTRDLLQTAKRPPSNNTAVLMGNPAFDFKMLAVDSPMNGQRKATATASSRSRDLANATLPALPGTQAEVQAISSLLKARHWKVKAYTQQNASKGVVMQVKNPRVLHLATHGFFEPDQVQTQKDIEDDQSSGLEDPMLRSGLYFAGANRRLRGQDVPSDTDDGILTAYEAADMDLQGTELVVLSACDTGLGKIASGEGVFGLRRALHTAGAETVLMSMWPVPDKETQELMTLFYQKWLSGKDKHEALREAQLEMRKRVKIRYGKDLPQYWGAFVLVGR